MERNIFLKQLSFLIFIFGALRVFAQPDITFRYKKTSSGLEYKILKKGKGRKVQASVRCFVSYSYYHKTDTGTLKAITELSKKDFIVGQDDVLKGWDEGFLLLKEGDSAVFKIPPDLAYGNKKVGSVLPNSTLYLFARLTKVQDAFFDHRNKDTIKFPSGLKKILVSKGYGQLPQPFDNVRMQFTGYVYSTKGFRQVFQSSYTNSAEAVFQLGTGRMLKGMDEGVASMEVGERATLIIPPNLGFGSQQVGRLLPNSTLYIDIELIKSEFPVIKEFVLDTIHLIDTSKLVLYVKKDTARISVEDIVTYNFKAYYLTNDGKPLVFDNSFERLTPIIQRPLSGIGMSFIDQSLLHLGSGEKALVILPSEKARRFSKNPNLVNIDEVYFEIQIDRVSKFPFMDINAKDTLLKYSGLKIIEGKIGTGDSIVRGTSVRAVYSVYYRDKYGNRRILDCTRETGRAMELIVGGGKNISGFEEGLLGMKPGGNRRLIIPPYLGYGDAGLPESGLPPMTDLIFDIEQIEILRQ